MFKRTLVATALCALTTSMAACSKTDSSKAANHLDAVPADTIMLVHSKNTKALSEFMTDYPMVNTPTDIAMFAKGLDTVLADTPKASLFFKSLARHIFSDGNYTYGSLMSGLDISQNGFLSLYFHGAAPVIRTDLNSNTMVDKVLTNAITESGWQPREVTIGGATVKLWDFPTKDKTQNTLSFAVLNHNNQLTMTLLSQNDSAEEQQQKLGLAKVANPINKTDKLANLAKKHNLLTDNLGFIDIQGIAKGIITPEQSAFGKDVLSMLPQEAKAKFTSAVDKACHTDYNAIFASIPTLALGYKSLNIKGDTLHSNAAMNLEITNTNVTAALSQLNGHVPSHVYNYDNSIISFGMGLNLENLTTSVTSLWTQFTQAPFTCPTLVQAQNQAKAQSPAMIAIAVGMVQSVKGMGVSIYDVFVGPDMQPQKLESLISIASSSPQSLTALTGMIPLPGLQGLQIPADGSPVEISVPGVPPKIKTFAAIKGKFITVYTGEKGKKAADALATETLISKDMLAMSADYSKLSGLVNQNMHLMSMIPGQSCLQRAELKQSLAGLDMTMVVSNNVDTDAFNTSIKGKMNKYVAIKTALKGGFTLSDFNNRCIPTVIGRYEFNADGTGSEINSSNDNACNLVETNFNWTQKGSVLTFVSSSNKERFSCDQPLSDAPAFTESCYMLNQTEKGFDCVFKADSDEPYMINVQRNP